MHSLNEMIAEARRELRKASGLGSPEDQELDRRKKAITELWDFLMRRLDVTVLVKLGMNVTWVSGEPVAILKDEADHVFHLRKSADSKICLLFIVDGLEKREIARIDAKDPLFSSKALVAIGDAGTVGEMP
jgi:hypothetical protein